MTVTANELHHSTPFVVPGSVTTAERAGIWLRVSTGVQDELAQLPPCKAWIKTEGYTEVEDAIYKVHGGSAYKGNKKFDAAWARVLTDMRSGKITVLIVWSLDRLDRKLNAFKMLEQVMDAGGRVEFVTQPGFNKLTSMGDRIAFYVQMEIAQQESEIKSGRIKNKQVEIEANGGLTGRPPFGYAVAGERYNKILVATDLGRYWVPLIFERYNKGASLDEIAIWLNANNIPTGQKKTTGWQPATVRGILRNPTYAGRHCERVRDPKTQCYSD